MPEKTKNLTVVKRDVNRNTSNQIISYGLPKSKEEEYGSVRLISAATFYDKESYKKVMGVVSDELINNNGELEITEQKLNYIKYKTIIAISEFVDIFSGRYEMTENATTPDGRKTSRDLKNRHFLNPSYINDGLRARGFEFQGYDQVPFDKTLKGPSLDTGRYVITKELIDSGRSLKFEFTLGARNNHTANVSVRMRFNRRRLPWNGGKGISNTPEMAKIIPSAKYDANNAFPILTLEYVLKNEDMVEFDTWEPVAFCGTGYKEFDISGEKSIFKVDTLEPDEVDSEILRTSPPFTVDTWTGNIKVNPDTGALIVSKGNAATTPAVVYKNWPSIFQPTPITKYVDERGVENKTQSSTAVDFSITVPDGYKNKGEKIKVTKIIGVYRTPTYFKNLENDISKKLGRANAAFVKAQTDIDIAQEAATVAAKDEQTAKLIFNGVANLIGLSLPVGPAQAALDKVKRAFELIPSWPKELREEGQKLIDLAQGVLDEAKKLDQAFKDARTATDVAAAKLQVSQAELTIVVNALPKIKSDRDILQTNYDNRRTETPFKILSTTVATAAPVASNNDTSTSSQAIIASVMKRLPKFMNRGRGR
eukprot:GHVU01200719.1.p1 GENE.GHVU01200719.1~~GHVU01200719.1.p1  ORF type:complete len:594 (-),score=65.19 GHVU01200719.1:1048-2829(-)